MAHMVVWLYWDSPRKKGAHPTLWAVILDPKHIILIPKPTESNNGTWKNGLCTSCLVCLLV